MDVGAILGLMFLSVTGVGQISLSGRYRQVAKPSISIITLLTLTEAGSLVVLHANGLLEDWSPAFVLPEDTLETISTLGVSEFLGT